jgi:hypothetical protein
MKDSYFYITSVGDLELKLTCDFLARKRIRFDVRDNAANVFSRVGGAVSQGGYRILVHPADVTRAKQFLGINLAYTIPVDAGKPFWIRFVSMIILIAINAALFLSILYQLYRIYSR